MNQPIKPYKKTMGGKSNVLITLLLAILFLMPTLGANAQTNEPYIVLKDGTATFYYNSSKPNGALPIQSDWDDANWPEDTRNSVTKVVFDASFKDYEPTGCANWFYAFENLTIISGMKENLNTANVTDMSSMFSGCSSLTTLDVSNFNTANVTDMGGMFFNCSSLTTLDVSNFNTANVTTMERMFDCCSSLTTLDLSNFNTANVKNMWGMFYDCSSLTTLDLSNFNTANVTTMERMFDCCSSLTTLDVSNFNTANVTDMGGMFNYCSRLTTLDVSNFNTANVTDMGGMFYNCRRLNAIFVGDDWSTASVTKSLGMFDDCTKLYGGKGTAYNADITNATYAKIDGGKDAPGYFTKSGEPAFTTPVSDISGKEIGIKVWSYNSTIYIETLPDTKYTIIDLNGRTIKSATTKSSHEEISITKSGVYIVLVNGESYKVSVN